MRTVNNFWNGVILHAFTTKRGLVVYMNHEDVDFNPKAFTDKLWLDCSFYRHDSSSLLSQNCLEPTGNNVNSISLSSDGGDAGRCLKDLVFLRLELFNIENLANCDIKNDFIKLLKKIFPTLTTLVLEMPYYNIGFNEECLFRLLANWPTTLSTLSINCNRIRKAKMIELFIRTEQLINLKHLALNNRGNTFFDMSNMVTERQLYAQTSGTLDHLVRFSASVATSVDLYHIISRLGPTCTHLQLSINFQTSLEEYLHCTALNQVLFNNLTHLNLRMVMGNRALITICQNTPMIQVLDIEFIDVSK